MIEIWVFRANSQYTGVTQPRILQVHSFLTCQVPSIYQTSLKSTKEIYIHTFISKTDEEKVEQRR